MIHPATRARFQRVVSTLLAWHRINSRSFVWRGLKRSPYIIMVREFMLQQTGARQVEKRLPGFLTKFPTLQMLAAAPRPDVIRAWSGLGYNRRAINLHLAAKAIVERKRFPKTLDALQSLPGIGRYTASAILCFAFHDSVPVVDVNIERVLSRLWKRMPSAHATLPISDIYLLDKEILPTGNVSDWHEALMDLGATICTKNSPKCEACPLQRACPSARKLSSQPIAKEASPEPLYFGQPRRIWRGRILRAVADMEPISTTTLTSLLEQNFNIRDASFVPFARAILRALSQEGFLRTLHGMVTLAEHR